jgi:hypothetical protein
VKRFIRHKATGMYFAEGQWQRGLERAQHFESLAVAVQAAISHHLAGAEVVLQLGDQPSEYYDIHLDLLQPGLEPGQPGGDRPEAAG